MKKSFIIMYILCITYGCLPAQDIEYQKSISSIQPQDTPEKPTTPVINGNSTKQKAEISKSMTAENNPELQKTETIPARDENNKTTTIHTTLQPKTGIEFKEHTMVSIGLDIDTRQHIASILHKLLANEYALYAKTQKYHWNIYGKFFGQLHRLFQQQYKALGKIIDQVAERSLALGIPSIGGLKQLSDATIISEELNAPKDDIAMIQQLLNDHEIIIKHIRSGIDITAQLNDMGTNNFLSDLITKHEKMAWMLRAHLQ
jgi:starvation-inducible DNA-binding protein